MKRLVRKSNHVSPMMHEDVNEFITTKDDKTLKRQTSDSYLIAKQIIMECEITPSNQNFLTVMRDIDSAKYSDIGKYKENKEAWNNRTRELFREKGILLVGGNNVE